MNLIDDYLKRQPDSPFATAIATVDVDQQNNTAAAAADNESKLIYFFNLFVELEQNYEVQLTHVKKLEETHKAELANVFKSFFFPSFKKKK